MKNSNRILPCTEIRAGMNDAAKQTLCIVHVSIPSLIQAVTHFTRGLPITRTQACEGGSNVTIEFFVPHKNVSGSQIVWEGG